MGEGPSPAPHSTRDQERNFVCLDEHVFPCGQGKTIVEKYSLKRIQKMLCIILIAFGKLARLPAVVPGMLE